MNHSRFDFRFSILVKTAVLAWKISARIRIDVTVSSLRISAHLARKVLGCYFCMMRQLLLFWAAFLHRNYKYGSLHLVLTKHINVIGTNE